MKKHSYKPLDGAMTTVQKVAHFLDWAASNTPAEIYDYPDILKSALNQPRRLSESSREVELIRSAMGRVRKLLKAQYSRGLVIVRGVGVRATNSDMDVAQNCVTVKARAVSAATARLAAEAELVDVSKLPNTVEGKAWASYMKTINGVVKENQLSNLAARLLPPPRKEP